MVKIEHWCFLTFHEYGPRIMLSLYIKWPENLILGGPNERACQAVHSHSKSDRVQWLAGWAKSSFQSGPLDKAPVHKELFSVHFVLSIDKMKCEWLMVIKILILHTYSIDKIYTMYLFRFLKIYSKFQSFKQSLN